jgi:PTH2 family peptidyl-tRNA hydrolase
MAEQEDPNEYKQVIIVRDELKMPKGKLAAQVSHAALDAALRTDRDVLNEWHEKGGKKVVLKVETEKELLGYFMQAKRAGLVAVLITDAGRTFLTPGTKTCVGIGPDKAYKINIVTGNLPML